MKNIVLIGMPSSGKTTIGEPLSKELKMDFIDTDKIILNNEKRQLRDIVIEDGLDKFLSLQEKTILDLDLVNHVISTGGSVIYNSAAMEHLKEQGVVFYLKLGLEEIENRIKTKRRFARNKDQSFNDLYNERSPLYEKYSDIIIDCSDKEVLTIVSEIKDIYEKKVKREMV
ncbi:UNVERIFIED_CONTAM: shikimate kinase [Acetivibrio alkalicellulosi]